MKDRLNNDIDWDNFKLNFDWGWGRYDYIKNGTYCSFVGVPPLGLNPHNFCPMEASPEQRKKWEQDKERITKVIDECSKYLVT